MTDYVLGLIPDYGLYVVFGVIVLACLAAPLPASVLVLATGSFAAVGDLVLWQVLTVTCLAFVIGDQLAYQIARMAGPGLLSRLRHAPKMDRLITRSEDLLSRRGGTAVLLSHTLLSPTCPYVSYLCGAGGMARARFSSYALLGAALWTTSYAGLGYVFANQLTQVSEILSDFIGLIAAAAVVVLSGLWLRHLWHAHHSDTDDAPAEPP